MVKRLPDPVLVPDHGQAMAGPGREVAVDTPTTTIGAEVETVPSGDATWHPAGWRPR